MMVLPEIKDALAGKNVKIIVDCGIVSGVEKFIKGVGDELRYIMSFTGFASVPEIDDSCLFYTA